MRRYKVSARFHDRQLGASVWYGQSNIGSGYTLAEALRRWVWFLIHKRTIAKIERKPEDRIYFSEVPVFVSKDEA